MSFLPCKYRKQINHKFQIGKPIISSQAFLALHSGEVYKKLKKIIIGVVLRGSKIIDNNELR